MKRSTFLTIAAVLAAVFGLGLLLAPDMMFKNSGLVVSDTARLFARNQGGVLFGLAIINWYVRNEKDSMALRGILLGNLVLQLFDLLIDAKAVVHHVIIKNPGLGLIVHGLLAGGFAYYYVQLKSPAVKKS